MAYTWDLSFFLIESHISVFEDALADPNGVQKRSLNSKVSFTGALYFTIGDQHEPGWSELIAPMLAGNKSFFPSSQSIAAVLFVRTQNGQYAYTFGIGGRNLLRRDALVPDFGKKVVLSIVDPKRLRSIDLRTIRDQPFFTRQHASRGTQLRSFGVDTLQDHLHAITGVPLAQHASLATRVTGADSLTYRAKLAFTELGTKCDSFRKEYNTAAYKSVADFKWVDQVSVVRDQQLIDALDGEMLAMIKTEKFDIAPGSFIDWARGPSFSFGKAATANDRLEFLSPASLIQHIGQQQLGNLTVAALKSVDVFCFYDNEAQHSEKWTAYDCLELDLRHKAKQYTLAGGRWSLVAPHFLKSVNGYIANLEANAPFLPDAVLATDGNATGAEILEDKYIHRICDKKTGATGFLRIHKCGKEVKFDGVEVELCDVYDVKRDLIHLKVWSSSQKFSALAMQAANSAEFLTDRQFAIDSRNLIKHVDESVACLPDGFHPRDYRIVFALIRRQTGPVPFFSRLTLMRAAQRVSSHFFRAAYVQIAVK